jgi:hypothetical protein
MFDVLHKVAFVAGRVSYANRYLRSQSYLEATATARISRGEFATEPCRSLFQRLAACFSPKLSDDCNVSVNKLVDGWSSIPKRGCRFASTRTR